MCDKGLKNLLKAIEAGIFTPTTKERMEELERQKEELNISLIRAQMAQPVFTKEEIVKWISRFKYGNINDKAYQREMIDTFLNSVYVYDDKIVFTYNFRDHAETVTLDEIEYVFCSDVNDCPPPIKRHRLWRCLFCCRKADSNPSESNRPVACWKNQFAIWFSPCYFAMQSKPSNPSSPTKRPECFVFRSFCYSYLYSIIFHTIS